MIFQKRFRHDRPAAVSARGSILVDILVALSIGTFFVSLITGSTAASRELFAAAKEENRLLDVYESGVAASSVSTVERPYGNDRIETDITVSGVRGRNGSAGFISFAEVRADPAGMSAAESGALCAPNLSSADPVGSYSFVETVLRGSAVPSAAPKIKVTPITLPISPSLPLTDVEVRDNLAYITADSASITEPDLVVADIRDASRPVVLAALHTGPGLVSLAVSGNKIYAAAPSIAGQLHVFGFDGASGLVIRNKFQLPLPYATATPPLGSAVFHDGDRLYIGTEKWEGEEFAVIDVSDPARPVKLGGLEIGSKVNDIVVRDGMAYVAASDERQLRLVDVSDPARPVLTDWFSPSGWERQEGKSFSFFEGALAFGRTAGGFNIAADHEAFVWGTGGPVSGTGDSADVPGGVYGIVSDRFGNYVASRRTGSELIRFDRHFSASTTVAYPLPTPPQALACSGDHLYVLSKTAPVIYSIIFE